MPQQPLMPSFTSPSRGCGESVQHTLRYWDMKVNSSRGQLEVMDAHGCHTFVFSSSATLNDYPEAVLTPGKVPIAPINTCDLTETAMEQMLANLLDSAPNTWKIARMRYLNTVGGRRRSLRRNHSNYGSR